MVKKSYLLIITLLVLSVFSNLLFAQTVEKYCLRADVLYFNEGDSAAALESLKKALEIDPTHTPSLRLYQLISEEFGEQGKGDEFSPETEVLPEEIKEKKAEGEKVKEEIEREEEIGRDEEKEKIEFAGEAPLVVSNKGKALSLYDCLEMALDRDPGLLRQKRKIEISGRRIREEKGGKWPSLRLDLSYTPAAEELKPDGPWDDTNEDYNALLKLYYEIYPGVIRSVKANLLESIARQLESASSIEKIRYQELRRAIIDSVATNFCAILEREEASRITEDTILKIKEHLKNVQERYDLGSVPRIKLLRTEDALDDSRRDLDNILLDLRIDRLKLSGLIGHSLDNGSPIAGLPERGLFLEQPLREMGFLKDNIERALAQRPELKRIKESMGYARYEYAYEYEKETNRTAWYPTFSFSGDYGLISDNFPPDREVYHIDLRLSIPLFGGGIDDGLRKERMLQHQELIAQQEGELKEMEDRIKEEIEVVYTRLTNSLNRLEIIKEEVKRKDKELSLARTRYQVQLETYSDVISAIRSLEAAKKRYVATKYLIKLNNLRLIMAVGLDPLKYIEDLR
ncbi:TolC family protein [bacterium]|nr:TolC family protein [bacterium]